MKVREWLGLQDRRGAGLFLVAIGCTVVFVSLALAREGAIRGHMLAFAGMACWSCGMSIGHRWKYLTKTPAQIASDVYRRGTPMTFAEKLLLRLSTVFFALSIYAHFVS